MPRFDDTIFAPATAPGRAGVAVVRVSGPQAGAALSALTRKPLPEARRATRARLLDAAGAAIDDALVLWFPGPASFTGEDVAELHVHGGRAVLGAVSDALVRMPGVRIAAPGEFTRRAFEHGKLDLTEAEGLADLVNAETEAQRKQSLRQLEGALGHLYESWRAQLIGALAGLEADIDFPDEALPEGLPQAARAKLKMLIADIAAHLADERRGQRLRDGIQVAIIGPPNAGKSSLFNALSQREAAIVAPTPGTTRDVIEVHLDLGGYPVTLADTAGIRASADAIEAEGVKRARARAADADVKLLLLETPDESFAALADDATICVETKIDLAHDRPRVFSGDAVRVSAVAGEGMADLLAALSRRLENIFAQSSAPVLTRERHRAALEDCVAALRRALDARALELIAEDVRLAARALGRITGRVDVEDVLDAIFREFCIGK
jgi:tRNA modification GTPase